MQAGQKTGPTMERTNDVITPVDQAVADLAAGKMIILIDDEQRENEGDLVCAAEKISPETVNFMLKHARGMLCLALTSETCDQLSLYPQVPDNTAPMGTAFTVTIDASARFGVTTGV